jgi:hypothetical protein
MDQRSSRAETLPALYRAILDDVGELERLGRRDLAARARRDAARAYAVWDDGAERRLLRLKADLTHKVRGRGGDERRGRRPWRGSSRSPGRAERGSAGHVPLPDALAEQAPTP